MKKELVIIGGGPAGLAAAVAAYDAGVRDMVVIEREERAGGILKQCIHNGFGLTRFHESMTGPEYAQRFLDEANARGIEIMTNTFVTDLSGDKQVTCMNEGGVFTIKARAVILAMGCRERSKGALNIAGTRPAGLFSAGTAQKYVNIYGHLPGKRVVILGSGDIGLIMARRMTLEGAKVECVCEIMEHSSGLRRNIAQCLDDFGIPLYLEHTIVEIRGKERVEGVVIAQVDKAKKPIAGTEREIACDTVLFSVGLIPENELTKRAGLSLDPRTKGCVVDGNRETDISGIFACGNVLHVHDLVDFVSEEAARAARNIPARLAGTEPGKRIRARAGANLKYVVPSWYFPGRKTLFSFRPLIVAENGWLRAEINGTTVWRKRMPFVRPAEMITAEVEAEQLSGEGEVVFHLQEGETE